MTNSKEETKKESLQQIRSVTDRVIQDGKITAKSDGTVHDIFPIAINAAQGKALRDWIVKEKPVNTIEIGLAWGISALYICEGLLMNGNQKAHHIAIDPFQSSKPKFMNCGLQVLEEAGVISMVEHISEESQIALPRFVSEGLQFDFAFVDGMHIFDRVFLDLIYLGRLVKPEGVIFCDDYQAESVAKAVSFCITNLGQKIEEKSPSSEHHKWVVLRTIKEPLHRMYPHFNEF